MSGAIRGALLVFLSVLVLWRGAARAAEVQIGLRLNGQTFAPGSHLTIAFSVESPGSGARGDLYLAALAPGRSLVFLGPGLTVSASPVSFERGRSLAPGSASLGSVPLGSAVPAGSYRMFALIVRPGTSPSDSPNHLSNLATAEFTFGAALSRSGATRLADQAVETPSLILRTVNDNTRAVLRTLAALRTGPGRTAATPCPLTTLLDLSPTLDLQGITFSALVDYGGGCRDDDDGEFRRGSVLASFEITRFDSRTLEPVAGTATLLFNEFFEGDASLSGFVNLTFAPGGAEITGLTTETSPVETLDLLYNLTSAFDAMREVDLVSGTIFLQSSVEGGRVAFLEETAFDFFTDVDPFTCPDPIGGRMLIGNESDFAVFRFGLPSPGCGFAFLSLNDGPEELVRLGRTTGPQRATLRGQGRMAPPFRAGLPGNDHPRRIRPQTGR